MFQFVFNITLVPAHATSFVVLLDGSEVVTSGDVNDAAVVPQVVDIVSEVWELGPHTLTFQMCQRGESIVPALDLPFVVGYDEEAVIEIRDGFLNVTSGQVTITSE